MILRSVPLVTKKVILPNDIFYNFSILPFKTKTKPWKYYPLIVWQKLLCVLNLRKTSIYYTVYSIFYGWNLNFWYVCAMLVQFSISDSYLNCKGAKQESTHARTNIHYNLLDCSRGQKWRVYSTENMSLCLFKLHTFKSEFHEIYISGKYRVFISTVTNKLSITDTTVHSLAQFGYLSCSIHQDIWYFVSNNPEICFKSLEANI